MMVTKKLVELGKPVSDGASWYFEWCICKIRQCVDRVDCTV